MNTSATWSSSRIATRVSWALEEMIISLVMPVTLQLHPQIHLRRACRETREQERGEKGDHVQPVRLSAPAKSRFNS
jgi:hypothetical protein